MSETNAYENDLAYIHDTGYGEFARKSAPGLLQLFRARGMTAGPVVDLGCGSGIWARALADAGYDVIGADLSPAMIELARRRVPEAAFHVHSFVGFPIPPCRAVTALGEVFNYQFDPSISARTLEQVCRRTFDALSPNGLLVFDVAEPGRCKEFRQGFRVGDNWACLVEYRQDAATARLTRRIISFRKIGETYRRHDETHVLQLYEGTKVAAMLRKIGFRVRQVRRYGNHPLAPGVAGFVARKP